MNPIARSKGAGLILFCLLLASTFSALLPRPASAQAGYEVVIRGKAAAYNINQAGDLPWRDYKVGDLPPIMAAGRVGLGAVVAGGIVATCRNGRWNDTTPPANTKPYLHVLLDKAFQWMKPGARTVLWYEGRNVYNDTNRCSELVAALKNRGYTVLGDKTEPITDELLLPFDILVIPQLQLGPVGSGGDPALLPDADVAAIKAFVEGGKGLLIMEGSDYGGYNFYKVQNKILEALNFGILFQDDQVSDPTNRWGREFELVADVMGEVGSAYQAVTGTSEIGIYSICSLAEPPRYAVKVSVSPLGKAGKAGETISYTLTVTNIGQEDDTYSLTSSSYADWQTSVEPASLSLEKGKSKTATLKVKIPDGTAQGDFTLITATATSKADEKVKSSAKAGVEVQEALVIGSWMTASKLCPYVPDYGVSVAGAGDSIYITNTSKFLRYKVTTGEWEDLPIPGVFMNGTSLTWDGGKYIYALGGGSYDMCKTPARRRYTLWRYDISANKWDTLANAPWFQGPGCALAWAKVGGKGYLYAFLGTSSRGGNPAGWEYFKQGLQFWRYDVARDNWDKRLADNPYGADDGANLIWTGGDYLYAFPGAYDEGLPPEEERHFLRYQISTDTWEELEKTPYNATGGVDDGGSLVWVDNYIYALKGGDDFNGGSTPARNFWRYSIQANAWEVLENIPAGVGDNNGRRLGVAGGNIYCWRGSFGDGTLWVYGLEERPTPTAGEFPLIYAVIAVVIIAAAITVVFTIKRR